MCKVKGSGFRILALGGLRAYRIEESLVAKRTASEAETGGMQGSYGL